MEHMHSSYINTRTVFNVSSKHFLKSRSFLLHRDRHLYEHNNHPITGYDETTGIQFVDWLMYTYTRSHIHLFKKKKIIKKKKKK